jgi:threonine-phosphate decarboxylase
LDFSANINPAGMPASLKQVLLNNVAVAERYPDPDYQQLHQALAAHHQVPVDWILAGNGETESIFTLVKGLLPRRVMLVTPGLPNIVAPCSFQGAILSIMRCVKKMAGR